MCDDPEMQCLCASAFFLIGAMAWCLGVFVVATMRWCDDGKKIAALRQPHCGKTYSFTPLVE
jgi:hypothetical protein